MLRQVLFLLAIALSMQLPVAQCMSPTLLGENRPFSLQVNNDLPKLQISLPENSVAATTADNNIHPLQRGVASDPKLQIVTDREGQKQAPKRTEEVTQWGDWYEYVQGTMLSSNPWAYEQLYGKGSFPERATMMRRDAVGNANVAQLKFPGFFGGIDFILDYDVPNKTVSWDYIDFGRKFPGDESDKYINATWGARYGRRFTLKQELDLSSFILVQPNVGYPLDMTFVPDTKPEAGFGVTLNLANVNDEFATLTFPNVSGAVDKIKYVITNEDAGVINGRAIFDLIEDNSPDLDIKAITAQEAASFSQRVNLPATGPYTAYAVAFDADGDPLLKKGYRIYSSIREPSKWREAGTGTFTDVRISELITRYQQYDGRDGVEITLPEWSNTKKWEVKIEESVETPGLYRVVNPYGESCPYSDVTFGMTDNTGNNGHDYTVIEFDRENDYYLLIHCENPAKPWIEASPAGFKYDYALSGNREPDPFNHIWSAYEGYVIGIHEALDTFVPQLTYENGRIYSRYGFEVTLPGYVDYTFSIEKSFTSAKITDLGSAAQKVKYTIVPTGKYTAEEGCALIRSNSPDITILEAANGEALDLEAFGVEYEKYYDIFAVSFDAAGNPQLDRSVTYASFHRYEYKYFAEVIYNDFVFSNSYLVSAYTADETPGVYYLRNPYKPYSQILEYDASADRYMAVDASNPDRVKIPLYDTGLSYESYGRISIQSAGALYENTGNDPDMIAEHGYYARFNRYGEIVIPTRGMCFTGSLLEADSWYGLPTTGSMVLIEFPGYADYRFSMRAITNGAEIYDIRADVDHIEYTVADASTTTEEALVGKLVARSSDIVIQRTSVAGSLDMSAWNPEVGKKYVVAAVSYNAAGVAQETVCVTFNMEPPYKYLGIGQMTDGFICNVFAMEDSSLDATWDVEVYELESTPGVVYVKNPYGEGYPYKGLFTSDFDETRWMEINISNPERVFIKEYYSGLSNGENQISMMTASEYFRGSHSDDEIAAAGYFGNFSDVTITVPMQAIMLKVGSKVVMNTLDVSDFKLILPESYSGVESVTVAEPESEAAEYFDLSGRRVLEPATGIYIVKRGTQVTKEVIRKQPRK